MAERTYSRNPTAPRNRVRSNLNSDRFLRKSPPTRFSSRLYIQSTTRPLVMADMIVAMPHGLGKVSGGSSWVMVIRTYR